jgi:hypothetical protein
MQKELRFGELVKKSGKPEIVSLWTDPRRDRSFMKAVKENRVLTLTQEPASKKKDFGKIGFHRTPHASYLIFPRPLPKGATPRVIGIKYRLMQQPRVPDPIDVSDEKIQPTKRKPERRKPKFDVIVRRTATIETSVNVEKASNRNDAKRKALQSIKAEPFDLTKAVMRQEVLGAEEQ